MGWIAKLFGAASKEELDGLQMDHSSSNWEIGKTKDLPSLLISLPIIIAETAILFFEGGRPSGELKSFLETHSIPGKEKIARGTVWPKQTIVHLPATKENISELVKLTDSISPFELAVHLHVYDDTQVIFEWHDAFTDTMYISRSIPEAKVKDFAESIGSNYGKIGESPLSPSE